MEMVEVGSCPKCGGMAQFIKGGEVRHIKPADHAGYSVEITVGSRSMVCSAPTIEGVLELQRRSAQPCPDSEPPWMTAGRPHQL